MLGLNLKMKWGQEKWNLLHVQHIHPLTFLSDLAVPTLSQTDLWEWGFEKDCQRHSFLLIIRGIWLKDI